MEQTIDFVDASRALDLSHIRRQLIRLEDTITFYLIERAQFPLNKTIYQPGAVKIPSSQLSLFDFILKETERLHSRVRRYEAPDEYPFFPDALENTLLQPLKYPEVLHPNTVDVNDQLKKAYIDTILPGVCKGQDRGEAKENYGSAAVADVDCLQALSKRIHFGKYVAEAKFQAETERFVDLIKKKDLKAIDDAITNAAVEAKVLERLRLKAKTYGVDPDIGMDQTPKVDVEAVVSMYKDYVIPLTKVVEVEYLMQRLQGTQWE